MRDNGWNKVKKPSLSMITDKLTECLKASDADMRPEAPFALAAIAYWRKLVSLRIMTEEDCDRRLSDEEVRTYIEEFVARNEPAIERISAQMGVEELQEAILGDRPDGVRRRELSLSAARLALRLLDVRDGESVLCGGASLGKFIEETCISFPHVRLTLLEEDRSLRRIWNIRAAVMGWPVQAVEGDNLKDYRADKIFLDTVAMSGQFDGLRKRLRGRLAGFGRGNSEESDRDSESGAWSLLFAALQKQAPGGKTLGLVIQNDLTEQSRSGSRERLVRERRAEAVIALPEDLDRHHIFQSYLFVCGEDCSTVRMVDASDVYTVVKPSSQKTFTEENIETILQRLGQDGEHSRALSPEELEERGYRLLPDADFLADEDFIHNLSGVPLKNICKIYRGAVAFSGKSLESRFSDSPTPFQYLQLKDVQEGFIRGPLPYLQSLDKKQETYCAQNGVLVMGKNAPLRVGMLETPGNAKVLLGGNIYAIEVKSEKSEESEKYDYDPAYIMIYLQSAEGRRQMNHALNGETAVKIITRKALENIKIPPCPLEDQRAFVAKYCTLDEERRNYLEEVAKIEKKMSGLLEEEGTRHDG